MMYTYNIMWIYIQDSLDQCPMPINAEKNSGIDPNANQFRSMPINSDQFDHLAYSKILTGSYLCKTQDTV